jgi:TolB protein
MMILIFSIIFIACESTPQVASPTPDIEPVNTNVPLTAENMTGKITYSYEDDVYVMNLDGSDITQLTTHPEADFDPVWSPDGTQIAFRSHRDGNEEVYVMNVDGSNQTNISNAPGGDYSPAWSPDGKLIAFMSDRKGGNPNVWVMEPDGSNPRQVTTIPGISEYPSWSPDSSQIVFHCTFGKRLSSGTGDFEICIVNADGSNLIQLTDTEGGNKYPAWSPDGAKIAFESDRDGWPTLPDYVPLGYDEGDFGDSEIYIMNIDGSEQVNISNHAREGDTFPAWSRDGHLIFSRYGCLWIMNADGSNLIRLSKDGCAGTDSGHFPDWYQPANKP